MNTRFALLVPCFNAEQYIDKFIQHLTNLSISFDEVIFYDDGSVDETYQKLKDHKVQVIRSDKNMGPGFARNQLIAASSSEWVHFHDIDDEMHPDFLASTSSKIQEDPNLDVVLCNADWVDPKSKKSIIQWKYSDQEIRENPLCYTISHPIGGINGLYKRLFLGKIGGFDESLPIWEDADLHVRLAHAGAKFKVVEEFLVTSFRYENTQSQDYGKIDFNRYLVLKKYFSLTSKKCEDTLQQELSRLFHKSVVSGNTKLEGNIYELASQFGIKLPYSENPFINSLKWFLPARTIVYLKAFVMKGSRWWKAKSR